MLKLKRQYFGHIMRTADLLEKTLMLGKIEGGRRRDDRGWDGWMASPTHWTWIWVNSGSWWWTGRPGVLQSDGSQGVRHDWAIELNSAYKINKQSDNIQTCHTPFPILNQSFVPCPVLTVASWPALQVSQEVGKVFWYSHLLKNFSQFLVIHSHRL